MVDRERLTTTLRSYADALRGTDDAEDFDEELCDVAHETASVLSFVWGDALEAGLDPAATFQDAAAIAGRRPLTHGRSASEVLASFEPLDGKGCYF